MMKSVIVISTTNAVYIWGWLFVAQVIPTEYYAYKP